MIRSTVTVYALLIAVGTLGAIGDAALNQWAGSRQLRWLLASYALWIVVATLFGLVLRMQHTSFGSAVVLALLAHSIVAIVIDRIWFLGRLTGWQCAGIFLAAAAITLIEIGRTTGSVEPK